MLCRLWEHQRSLQRDQESPWAPLKSATGEVIKDKAKQMDRWVEHYAKLYGRGNTLTDTAYEAIETLTSMPELDEPPNELELSKAIDCLHTGKAPGLNSIPPEFIKCAKSTLLGPLHKLLCQCWEEGEVPQGSIRTRRTGVTVTTTGESPF